MRISDWSSDVCSSDVIMGDELAAGVIDQGGIAPRLDPVEQLAQGGSLAAAGCADHRHVAGFQLRGDRHLADGERMGTGFPGGQLGEFLRSEEHTSELQSLMRISYAVFCLNKT